MSDNALCLFLRGIDSSNYHAEVMRTNGTVVIYKATITIAAGD